MLPPPPKSALFPYTTLFRSRTLCYHAFIAAALLAPLAVARAGEIDGEDMARLAAGTFVLGTLAGIAFIWGLARSEEHTSELQSQSNLVCRLLLEKKNKQSHF